LLTSPNIFMIGGNIRHAGKTTLACGLIRKFNDLSIVGLKVTSIYPGESKFHGDHSNDPDEPWSISEETDPSGEKDTSLMLRAGAEKVYFIRTSGLWMDEAWNYFTKLVSPGSLIICESRSLRELIKPGIFILMMRETDPEKAKDMTGYIHLADEICNLGNNQDAINGLIERINVKDQSWFLDQ
jgi:hypothetical protein